MTSQCSIWFVVCVWWRFMQLCCHRESMRLLIWLWIFRLQKFEMRHTVVEWNWWWLCHFWKNYVWHSFCSDHYSYITFVIICVMCGVYSKPLIVYMTYTSKQWTRSTFLKKNITRTYETKESRKIISFCHHCIFICMPLIPVDRCILSLFVLNI